MVLIKQTHTPQTIAADIDTEMIEEKIGEVLGLEMAAQKAVEKLVSKGSLSPLLLLLPRYI